jgi:glycerophosphoryl diester phosphodiesterase
MKGTTLIIAHRGFSGEYLQNSRKAIDEAVKIKVDMVELDIRKTKDNSFVIFHDRHLQRATDGRGLVKDKTVEELKKNALKDGSQIVTLKEALKILKNTKTNLHLKDYLKKEDLLDFLTEIKGYEKNILVSSYSYPDLRELRKLDKKITIVLNCVLPLKKNIKKAAQLNAYAVYPHFIFLLNQFTEEAHKNKIKVFAYTHYSLHSMQHLIDCNVDGILTDFPDKLHDLINHYKQK